MEKKLFKLMLFTFIAGIINRFITIQSVKYIMAGGSEWTLEMGSQANFIQLIVSIFLFFAIGLIVRKVYDRKSCIKAVSVLVGYNIIILVIEQIAQSFGAYGIFSILYYLYLPIEMFSSLITVLFGITNVNIWVSVIISMFMPYLFVLFTKKDKEEIVD